MDVDEQNVAEEPARKANWWRIGAMLTIVAGFAIVGHAMGWTDGLTPESVKIWIVAAGAWGVLLYIGAFAAGNLMQVPGMAFIVSGCLVYGPFEGAFLAALASILAVCTSFFVVRLVGGSPLGAVRNKWMRKALDGLNRKPVRSIAAMRVIMVTSPPLNYLLAMSDVRFRDYLAGSAAGMIVPIAATAIAIELGIEVFEGFGILFS